MANKEKTKLSLISDFPHDMATYKPYYKDVEVFDRASENPAHRFSLKSSDDKYCVISEDEKFVFELMDGEKTIDEIAAEFMESKGKVAISMIRSLTFRLWQNGILVDPERDEIPEENEEQNSEHKFSIPGLSTISSILYPFPGVLFINPISFIILIGLGLYGTNLLNTINQDFNSQKTLFIYNNDTTYGLGILAISILAAALIRFISLCMAHKKYKIKIKSSGLIFSSGFLGLYVDAPGVTVLKAGQRFWLRVSGMIIVFGLSGVFFFLSNYSKTDPNLSLLYYQAAFYMIIYLLYHCCPLTNSDLYLACSDYLDEHYLRKSSFNFIQSHIKSFFAPEKSEKGDNVVYIMFCAGAALWIVGSAQFLLSAISQNSAFISGIFDKEQAASTLFLFAIIILPILSGIIVSSYFMYKFFIKSVLSIPTFQISRNMIILIFTIALILLFLIRITDDSTRYVLYLVLALAALVMSLFKSFSLAKFQSGSLASIQGYALTLFVTAAGLAFTAKALSPSSSLTYIMVIIMSISLVVYSLMNLKVDWSEFIYSRKDSLIISTILIISTMAFWYMNDQFVQFIGSNDNNVFKVVEVQNNSSSKSVALFSFLALALSFILNLPGVILRRNTEMFSPVFSIFFASHLVLYFSLVTLVSGTQLIVLESVAAASILLLVGLESYNYVYLNPIKNLEIFPLQDGENEKLSLTTGFQYIIENTLKSIGTDFGNSRISYIERNFKQYCQKMQWQWDLANIPKDGQSLNTLGDIYKNSFQKVQQLTSTVCGENYAKRLFTEIEDHLHSQAKAVIKSRVGELSEGQKSTSDFIMSEDKKKELISKTIFFEDIKGAQLDVLKECLHTAFYEEGELVIKQHDEGDRLFIIAEGKTQVEISDLAGNSQIVSYILPGEFFGDIALLTSSPRTASVRACENTTLLYIKKKDFDAFLNLNPEKKDKVLSTLNYLRLIKSIPLFRELDSSIVNLLAGKMIKEDFKTGDAIIKQGEDGDKFYIILEGECDVHVDRDDKKNHKVATLSKGEYFGEIALIRDIPRTATITAVSAETLVLSLQKKDFVDVISSHELLASNFNDASHRRLVEMMH